MTKEELLKVRYKVIARWPDMARGKFFEGQIIHLISLAGEQPCTRMNNSTLYDAYFDSFPHLFKKLEWWEERKEKELPEYLKRPEDQRPVNKEIYKITEYKESANGIMAHYQKGYQHISWFTPATEEEYNTYNSQKQ